MDIIDKTNSVEVVDGNKDIFENVFATYDRNYVKVPVLNAFTVNTGRNYWEEFLYTAISFAFNPNPLQ